MQDNVISLLFYLFSQILLVSCVTCTVLNVSDFKMSMTKIPTLKKNHSLVERKTYANNCNIFSAFKLEKCHGQEEPGGLQSVGSQRVGTTEAT